MKPYEIFLTQADKQAYLNENWLGPVINYPFAQCLHCGHIFKPTNFKVTLERDGAKEIRCPDWPECDGTANDWVVPQTLCQTS